MLKTEPHPAPLADALRRFDEAAVVLAGWAESRGPLFEKPGPALCRALALAQVRFLADAAGSECTRIGALETFLRYEAESWPEELGEEGHHIVRVRADDGRILDEVDITALEQEALLPGDPQKVALCGRRLKTLRGYLEEAFYVAADNIGTSARPEYDVRVEDWRKKFASLVNREMLGWHGGLERVKQEMLKFIAKLLAELLLAGRERWALRTANALLRLARKIEQGKKIPKSWIPPPAKPAPPAAPPPGLEEDPWGGKMLVLEFDELPFGKPPSGNGSSP